MFRPAGLRAWGVLLALAVAAGVRGDVTPARAEAPYQDQIQNHQQQMEALRKQASEKRARAKQFARDEKGVLDRLNKAEQAIAATRKYIRSLEERQVLLEDDIRRQDRELGGARQDLDARRSALAGRLVHSYKHGRARTLEVVFSAETFAGLLQRSAFLNRVLRQDRQMVLEVEEREAAIQNTLDQLRRKRAEVTELRSEKAREEQQYQTLRAKRAADLQKVRNQKTENEQAARELEQAAARLQQLMAELERKRIEELGKYDPVLAELDHNDFSRNRGRLPWPVAGNVISEFGPHEHPKYKTITLNNGLDIAAPLGTPVRAVGDGVVSRVQWLTGYGESIIINHGRGFYSIYSHLSGVDVAVGDRVTPGQVIGSVGDTGSLKGSCLHFELRSGSDAQDPRSWLR